MISGFDILKYLSIAVILSLVVTGGFFMVSAGSDNAPDSISGTKDSVSGYQSEPFEVITVYTSSLASDKSVISYSEAMDYKNPAVQSFAFLRISSGNAGEYSYHQAFDMWDYLQKNWVYANDPKGPEYISKASDTIKAGLRGDCDDYSVFLSSLILSLGGKCRIIESPPVDGSNTGHAYPELFIGTDKNQVVDISRSISAEYGCEKVYYSISNNDQMTEYWLNLDWSGKNLSIDYYRYGDSSYIKNSNHPGREYYNANSEVTIYYPDGKSIKSTPQHGYYMQKMNGVDTLNAL